MKKGVAIKEYMDYATIHGIGRMKNSPYKLLKVLWILALIASLAVITWQVYGLYKKYKSYPISTNIEIAREPLMEFPEITICNPNPIQWGKIDAQNKASLRVYETISETIVKYNLWQDVDAPSNASIDIENDILRSTAEKVKMALSVMDLYTLESLSQPMYNFIQLCSFAGSPCTDESLEAITRSYDYGICHTFDPKKQLKHKKHPGHVSSAGPNYALELLVNIDETNTVPLVTSSSGVIISATTKRGSFFSKEDSHFIPTGFEANIGLSKVEYKRMPGKDPNKIRCRTESNDTLSDCKRKCIQDDIWRTCGCYQYFFDVGTLNGSLELNETYDQYTGYRPCYTETHYKCIQDATYWYLNEAPAACSECRPPCYEDIFEWNIGLGSWPSDALVEILNRILDSSAKSANVTFHPLTRGEARLNMALVRIYLNSLSYQKIAEEYSYEAENFISDIGGQLGLFAGFSVLSILELVELVVLLFPGCKRASNTVDDEEAGIRTENNDGALEKTTL